MDRKTEEIFKKDLRFLQPLYLYVAMDSLTWVWCLCVISGVYPSFLPAWIFKDRITQSIGGFWAFTFVWGYMSGVNGLAGHELIHKRNAFDKFIGMTTYTKILYSHFLLEHSSGHHRNVATPDDAATAMLGENFYTFALRSAYQGHYKTWERENARLCDKHKIEEVPLLLQLAQNRIFWFTALHFLMLATIQIVFGTRAVLF